jgi:hypothetical protein
MRLSTWSLAIAVSTSRSACFRIGDLAPFPPEKPCRLWRDRGRDLMELMSGPNGTGHLPYHGHHAASSAKCWQSAAAEVSNEVEHCNRAVVSGFVPPSQPSGREVSRMRRKPPCELRAVLLRKIQANSCAQLSIGGCQLGDVNAAAMTMLSNLIYTDRARLHLTRSTPVLV